MLVVRPLNTLAVPEATATEYDPVTGIVLFPVESEKAPVLVAVLNTMLLTPVPLPDNIKDLTRSSIAATPPR